MVCGQLWPGSRNESAKEGRSNKRWRKLQSEEPRDLLRLLNPNRMWWAVCSTQVKDKEFVTGWKGVAAWNTLREERKNEIVGNVLRGVMKVEIVERPLPYPEVVDVASWIPREILGLHVNRVWVELWGTERHSFCAELQHCSLHPVLVTDVMGKLKGKVSPVPAVKAYREVEV